MTAFGVLLLLFGALAVLAYLGWRRFTRPRPLRNLPREVITSDGKTFYQSSVTPTIYLAACDSPSQPDSIPWDDLWHRLREADQKHWPKLPPHTPSTTVLTLVAASTP